MSDAPIEWKKQRGAGNQLQYVAAYSERIGMRLASMEEAGMGWAISVMGSSWEIGMNVPDLPQAKRGAELIAASALTFVCGVVAQLGHLEVARTKDEPRADSSG